MHGLGLEADFASVLLYCNFRSFAFLGFLGFLIRQLKTY